MLQNHQGGKPDGTSVIFPLESTDPYYPMGIRMSFGRALDPVTGYLWDTEAGGVLYDEVNLVTPNFNSGWAVIMGLANSSQLSNLPSYQGYNYLIQNSVGKNQSEQLLYYLFNQIFLKNTITRC